MTGKIEHGGQSGFSMVELLFALVILAVGLLGIIQLQVSSMASLAKARHQTTAMEIAERKMELLKTLPYQVDQPNVTPLDENDNPILDAQDQSIFFDNIVQVQMGSETQYRGDLKATLHWDNPVDEHGNPIPAFGAGSGKMAYVVMWTIERGGSLGTPWPNTDPLQFVPPYVPGPNQMAIRVIVGWYEIYDKKKGLNADAFDFEQLGTEFDIDRTSTEKQKYDPIYQLFETLPNRVELESLRDSSF